MYAGCCYAHKMHIVVMRLHIVYADVEAGVLHIFAHHVAFICFYNNLQHCPTFVFLMTLA